MWRFYINIEDEALSNLVLKEMHTNFGVMIIYIKHIIVTLLKKCNHNQLGLLMPSNGCLIPNEGW